MGMCIGFLAAAEGRSECFHVQTLELLLNQGGGGGGGFVIYGRPIWTE